MCIRDSYLYKQQQFFHGTYVWYMQTLTRGTNCCCQYNILATLGKREGFVGSGRLRFHWYALTYRPLTLKTIMLPPKESLTRPKRPVSLSYHSVTACCVTSGRRQAARPSRWLANQITLSPVVSAAWCTWYLAFIIRAKRVSNWHIQKKKSVRVCVFD